MTKRIITEKEMDKMFEQATWKMELKYSERPDFKRLIEDVKKKRMNCVLMVNVSDLSQNPADVKEACRMLKDLGAEVRFVQDNLTGEDILKMNIFTLDNLTINTVKEDILIVVNSEETYNKWMKQQMRGDIVKVKDLIIELLNHDLDSKVVLQVNTCMDNKKITVIGNEIQEIYTATGMSGTVYTTIETKFADSGSEY